LAWPNPPPVLPNRPPPVVVSSKSGRRGRGVVRAKETTASSVLAKGVGIGGAAERRRGGGRPSKQTTGSRFSLRASKEASSTCRRGTEPTSGTETSSSIVRRAAAKETTSRACSGRRSRSPEQAAGRRLVRAEHASASGVGVASKTGAGALSEPSCGVGSATAEEGATCVGVGIRAETCCRSGVGIATEAPEACVLTEGAGLTVLVAIPATLVVVDDPQLLERVVLVRLLEGDGLVLLGRRGAILFGDGRELHVCGAGVRLDLVVIVACAEPAAAKASLSRGVSVRRSETAARVAAASEEAATTCVGSTEAASLGLSKEAPTGGVVVGSKSGRRGRGVVGCAESTERAAR
jgi:hypothetical protein